MDNKAKIINEWYERIANVVKADFYTSPASSEEAIADYRDAIEEYIDVHNDVHGDVIAVDDIIYTLKIRLNNNLAEVFEKNRLVQRIDWQFGNERKITIHYGNHNIDHKDYLEDFGVFSPLELSEFLTENKKSSFEVFDKIDGNKEGVISYSDF